MVAGLAKQGKTSLANIMRLNKFLATAGVASRRSADTLIIDGRIAVNGQTITELGIIIDPTVDQVSFDGQLVSLSAEAPVVYLLNKPRGVVTTARDPHGRPTVLEYVPKTPRVFPCGRLDEDTQGLVILTNDGNLCYQLTHPKFEHQKEYLVHGHAANPAGALAKIQTSVLLKDGPIKPDRLETLKIHHDKVEFLITVHEGRNRIVRRLCAKVGIEIDTLTRLRVGKFELGKLKPGEYQAV